jgi:hypothetical protein
MPEPIISPSDRQAIYDNLRRYAWCLDRADGDGVAACFTRDGIVQTTSGQQYRNPGGPQEFVRQASSQEGFFGRQHHVQPLLIEKADEGYMLTSYWMVVTWHEGAAPFLVSLGHYRDHCVLEDGEWRFAKKTILRWDDKSVPRAN